MSMEPKPPSWLGRSSSNSKPSSCAFTARQSKRACRQLVSVSCAGSTPVEPSDSSEGLAHPQPTADIAMKLGRHTDGLRYASQPLLAQVQHRRSLRRRGRSPRRVRREDLTKLMRKHQRQPFGSGLRQVLLDAVVALQLRELCAPSLGGVRASAHRPTSTAVNNPKRCLQLRSSSLGARVVRGQAASVAFSI
jgi:hypothetical protein